VRRRGGCAHSDNLAPRVREGDGERPATLWNTICSPRATSASFPSTPSSTPKRNGSRLVRG
jgi:hypothetical protein